MNEKYVEYENIELAANIFKKADIKPVIFRRLRRFRAILAGGSLLSELFHIGEVNDYDFYFRDKYAYNEAVMMNEGMHRPHATLHTNTYKYSASKPLQYVNMIFGSPEEILDSFDMTVCQLAYDVYNNKFIFSVKGLEDIENKIIRFNNFKNPLGNMRRAVKYINKGLKLPVSELTKIKIFMSNMSEDEIYHNGGYNSFTYKQYEDEILKLFGRFNFNKPLHEHLMKRLAEKCIEL